MSAATAVLLSWSGGKDAAWALHGLREQADFQVVGLVTTITAEYDRASMQGIRREVLHAQADAVGLPLMEVSIPAKCSNADYEAALHDGLRRVAQRWPDLQTMAFGDLHLEDIRAYRATQLAGQGWNILTPIFGSDTALLAREMIAGGLRASLCCVDTTQLPASFAGRRFDLELLSELPPGIDHCGENGEFHTCVYDGPMFNRPITLTQGETVVRDARFAYTDFTLTESSNATLPENIRKQR